MPARSDQARLRHPCPRRCISQESKDQIEESSNAKYKLLCTLCVGKWNTTKIHTASDIRPLSHSTQGPIRCYSSTSHVVVIVDWASKVQGHLDIVSRKKSPNMETNIDVSSSRLKLGLVQPTGSSYRAIELSSHRVASDELLSCPDKSQVEQVGQASQ